MDATINSISVKKDSTLSKWLFFTALILKLVQWDLSIALLKIQFNVVVTDVLCFVLLLLALFTKKSYPLRLFVLFVGISLFSILVYLRTGVRDVVLIPMFIFSSYDIEFRDIVKCVLFIKVFFLVVCTVLSLVHLIPNYTFYESRGIRKSIGYVTYNYAPRELFYIICYYIFLKKNNFTLIELVVIETIAFYYSQVTMSRATFYLITLLIIIVVVNKVTFNNLFKFKVMNLSKYVFILASVITFIILKLYSEDPVKYKLLNVFTTGRLEYSISALDKYGISWLGQKIEWIGLSYKQSQFLEYNYVDNSYLQMLLNYGILYTLLVIIFLTIICRYAMNIKNYNLVILMIIIAGRAIVEPQLWVMQYNIFMFLLLPALTNILSNIKVINVKRREKA
ncbi:hypothetical protein [Ligilactobacillus agilis]|uniref:hypothetical protein n=1 Tax=Ligilactobacillus agilis TaxID=1601 RepID=UPI003F8A93F9